VKNLSGFAGIGNMFPAQWNWYAFWSMTAFLSIILAFMNILPIPALDGGHIMFLLYEVITRRQPNEKFMEYAQIGGMIFLLLLLIVANGNDIMRIFFK
jgi:regulator of sigma E protease